MLCVTMPMLMGGLVPAPAAWAGWGLVQPENPPASAWRDDLALLLDAGRPGDARAAACRRLLASLDQAAIAALGSALGPEHRAADYQPIVLRELGQVPTAPESLLKPLAAWLKESTPDKHIPFYRAISSIRTRPAAQLLLSYAGPSATTENREAIYQCLSRLTGKPDLGTDRGAWARWLAAADQWTDEQWRDQLAANHASRADVLRAQRDEAFRRLVESERARFLGATDPQARAAILASILRDDLPAVRRLGIDLVNRELANAREVGPEVAAATLELLRDPSSDVRSVGADIVDRLIPAGAALAIRDALAREQDPNVLAKLLRLARRFPDIAPPELCLGWPGIDTTMRRAALDAVAALQDAGLVAPPIDVERALRTLRTEKLEELSIDGLKLLCELGNEADRQAVARMLRLPSADARLRAAQALAPFPERLDDLLAAAREDSTLFSVVATSLTRHRPTIAGYDALMALASPSPLATREAVSALCQRLSLPDLVHVASNTSDPEIRETILGRVVNLTARDSASPDRNPFQGDDGAQLAAALLLLAETQLELTRPGAALGTLDLLPANGQGADPSATSLRLRALLYLDRLEDAMNLDAPPDAWLDGLAYSVSLPHALAIAAEIELRFPTELTSQQLQRLDSLKAEARKPRG